MKIKYKLENGQATNICYVKDYYVLQENEYYAPFHEITRENVESLHSQEYKDSLVLNEQKQKCLKLLEETDCKLLPDFPYPNDLELWKNYRQQLRNIISGNTIQAIPDKPF